MNLNGLLVTRQIDNISPGGGGGGAPGGKLVLGSHKRCELRNTVIISAEEIRESGGDLTGPDSVMVRAFASEAGGAGF